MHYRLYYVETVPALGHDWDEGEVIYEASCEGSGEIRYTCKRCNETKKEITGLAKGDSIMDCSSKVVRVDSKGRITAKKKGTAVITVKAGKKTVKCKVIVK